MVNVPYFLDGEQRESLLVDADEAMRKRETTVLRREALMQEREEALERIQALYKHKELEMKAAGEQTAQREAQLDSRETELAEREERVAERERQLESIAVATTNTAVAASDAPVEIEIKAEPVDVGDEAVKGRKLGVSKRRAASRQTTLTPAATEASVGSGQPKRRRTRKAKNAEKHPRSAWNFWLTENMPRLAEHVRQKGSGAEPTIQRAVFRLGAEEWACVTDKSRWEEMAHVDRETRRSTAPVASER